MFLAENQRLEVSERGPGRAVAAIDMDEIAMIDFVSEAPSPSLHDLRLLGPYLFRPWLVPRSCAYEALVNKELVYEFSYYKAWNNTKLYTRLW